MTDVDAPVSMSIGNVFFLFIVTEIIGLLLAKRRGKWWLRLHPFVHVFLVRRLPIIAAYEQIILCLNCWAFVTFRRHSAEKRRFVWGTSCPTIAAKAALSSKPVGLFWGETCWMSWDMCLLCFVIRAFVSLVRKTYCLSVCLRKHLSTFVNCCRVNPDQRIHVLLVVDFDVGGVGRLLCAMA